MKIRKVGVFVLRTNPEKLKRLAQVAQRYYIEDCKQSDIAKELGVSRPLISRMLSEARTLGVVEITIHQPSETGQRLMTRLQEYYAIKGGSFAPDGTDAHETNQILCKETMALLSDLSAQRIGIGWGHFVGQLVSWLEGEKILHSTIKHICPMVGNAGVPIRNYHSNENVRLLATQLSATPYFLYLPALAESVEEKELFCSTELYHNMEQQWAKMDTALVNIGNYPSTPDFASVARYGTALSKHKACGRLVAYYYNEAGEIIPSHQDSAIQIPLPYLKSCKQVIGLCSANTGLRALRGALNTGLFTHIVARQELIAELLKTYH